HRLAEVARQQLEAAIGGEGRRGGGENLRVARLGGGRLEGQPILEQPRLDGVGGEAAAPDGLDVLVQVAGAEQFADHKAHAAGGVEVVHVGEAVGIDARQQRHNVGKVRHVLPGDVQPGRGGDGDEVQRVVGRAAGGVQADEAVDDRLLVDDVADRRIVVALG